jgi:hypothetical protein
VDAAPRAARQATSADHHLERLVRPPATEGAPQITSRPARERKRRRYWATRGHDGGSSENTTARRRHGEVRHLRERHSRVWVPLARKKGAESGVRRAAPADDDGALARRGGARYVWPRGDAPPCDRHGPPRVARYGTDARGAAATDQRRRRLGCALRRFQLRRRRDTCVEINQCVGCTRQFFTKSFLGDDAADLSRSSGEEPASPRHRAGVASMAWRTTR